MGTFPDNGDVPYLSNRLKGVDNPDGSITEYEFDSCGNIKLEYCVTDRYTEKTSFFYDSENRLLMKDGASAVTMQYDKNGNLIKRTDGIGQAAAVSHFGYDAFGRLTSFSRDSANAKYTYNPEGMRSGKTVNEISTRYIYDNGNILSSVSDGSYTGYNRGTELISVSQYGKEKLYYQTDSHGDVTALHTPDGTEAHSYQYTAYGDEVRAAQPSFGENVTSQLWQTEVTADQNPFRYCGEYTDPETGLIYLRNRYYDPTVGRFISEDPAKDGMNWYVYCGNNPVNFTDSFGLDSSLDKYISKNYKGMTVALVVGRPVPNSREVAYINSNGQLENGHSFLRLDDGNGNVKYLGFSPKNKSLKNMLLAYDCDGKMIDDSDTQWNVAKVYCINNKQYNSILTFMNDSEKNTPNYNIESFNCTTWAISGIKKAGITPYAVGVREHRWTLPDNLSEQIDRYSAKGKTPTWIATIAVSTMGRFYGYTPADAAQDLKKCEGTTLLQYDSTGIRKIQNKSYLSKGI